MVVDLVKEILYLTLLDDDEWLGEIFDIPDVVTVVEVRNNYE